jgi:hypothetical protein
MVEALCFAVDLIGLMPEPVYWARVTLIYPFTGNCTNTCPGLRTRTRAVSGFTLSLGLVSLDLVFQLHHPVIPGQPIGEPGPDL